MNKLNFEIEKCCDCPYHYVEPIYTEDWFEHESGLYCSKVEDKKSYNQRNKLVVEDEWDVRKYSNIPDWCPLLNKAGDKN